MRTKIVEALAEILEEMHDKESFEEIHQIIKNKNKYDKETISAAFGLVYEKLLNIDSSEIELLDRTKNFRVLSEEESDTLGIENYNYLMKLHNIGVLDDLDYEKILDQLTLLPKGHITKEDINFIVLFSLVDLHNDIIPGSRILLYSSDTIN